jgi:hypothetical protein
MTAIADATLIIETLIGRTLTTQQLINIGQRYKYADPCKLNDDEGRYVDRNNPTNEELAQLFLDTTLMHAKVVVFNSAEGEEYQNSRAAIENAGAAARADLE